MAVPEKADEGTILWKTWLVLRTVFTGLARTLAVHVLLILVRALGEA